MIAANRITTGPSRVLRRLARKLTKPLRLAVIKHQLALSEGNVLALEGARLEATELMRDEALRQVRLMQARRQVEGW